MYCAVHTTSRDDTLFTIYYRTCAIFSRYFVWSCAGGPDTANIVKSRVRVGANAQPQYARPPTEAAGLSRHDPVHTVL